MKKIDEGLQYTVYRMNDSKVRKVPKQKSEMTEYLMEWKETRKEAEKAAQKALKRRKKLSKIWMIRV
jgi:hypothetical protein